MQNLKYVGEQDHQDDPDDKFTTWERETYQAKAATDVEEYRYQKQTLKEKAQEARQKRVDQLAKDAQKKREHEWLARIKRIGLDLARQLHPIPGAHYGVSYAPPAVVSAVARSLDENITLTTCPMPQSESDYQALNDASRVATACAQEHINTWLAAEKTKNEEIASSAVALPGFDEDENEFADDDIIDDDYDEDDDGWEETADGDNYFDDDEEDSFWDEGEYSDPDDDEYEEGMDDEN